MAPIGWFDSRTVLSWVNHCWNSNNGCWRSWKVSLVTLQIGDTKQVTVQFNTTWLRTGTCLIASRIFISQIFILHFDILNIPLVLKQKCGNWKMETIRSSSRQLQASITALVFLRLISTFAVNDFLCEYLWGNKNFGKMINCCIQHPILYKLYSIMLT